MASKYLQKRRVSVFINTVKMCYAMVKGVSHYLAAVLVGCCSSEVMPQAEAHGWQQHSTLSTTAICHATLVAVLVC